MEINGPPIRSGKTLLILLEGLIWFPMYNSLIKTKQRKVAAKDNIREMSPNF